MTKLEELQEARRAYSASIQAVQSHGYQAITWKFLEHDSARLARLEREFKEARDGAA